MQIAFWKKKVWLQSFASYCHGCYKMSWKSSLTFVEFRKASWTQSSLWSPKSVASLSSTESSPRRCLWNCVKWATWTTSFAKVWKGRSLANARNPPQKPSKTRCLRKIGTNSYGFFGGWDVFVGDLIPKNSWWRNSWDFGTPGAPSSERMQNGSSLLSIWGSHFYGGLYVYIYIHLEPKWPLFWLEKALFWGGWPSKIEVIGVLGTSCSLEPGFSQHFEASEFQSVPSSWTIQFIGRGLLKTDLATLANQNRKP